MKKILRNPLSIRIFHWITVISVLLLSVSGFYITSPFSKNIFTKMDAARFVHFTFMWILVAMFVFRIYLAFAGKYGRHIMFSWQDLKKVPALFKYNLFLSNKEPDYTTKYNVGQKIVYSSWVLLIIVQIITGFILYYPGQMYKGALDMGGFMMIRLIHNAVFWYFACTITLHVYLEFAEGGKTFMAMITGYTSTDVHPESVSDEGLDLVDAELPLREQMRFI